MAYQVPKSKASIKQNRFQFQIPGSTKVHELPLLKYLPIGIAARLEESSTLAETLEVFGETADIVGTLDSEQLEALMAAWRAESGVTEGESPASSDS